MAATLQVTLFWYRPHRICSVNQLVLMITSWYLNEKSREVCIKARPPPASLVFIGQVTKHTTAQWRICFFPLFWCTVNYILKCIWNKGKYQIVPNVKLNDSSYVYFCFIGSLGWQAFIMYRVWTQDFDFYCQAPFRVKGFVQGSLWNSGKEELKMALCLSVCLSVLLSNCLTITVFLYVCLSVSSQSVRHSVTVWVDLDALKERTKGVKKWLVLFIKTK